MHFLHTVLLSCSIATDAVVECVVFEREGLMCVCLDFRDLPQHNAAPDQESLLPVQGLQGPSGGWGVGGR